MKPALHAKLNAELNTPTDPSSTELRKRKLNMTQSTFAIRDLSVLAYADGFTLWHYKTGNDSLETVSGDHFFDPASDMMAVGDLVMISGANGATMRIVAFASGNSVLTAKTV